MATDRSGDVTPPALGVLLENQRLFLGFVERRVGSREAAEDILQDAFTRNLGRIDQIPDEAVVPWFYRTLLNAAIDHYRRRATADKTVAAFAKEMETAEAPPQDVHREICACVSRLAATLKPEYADILQAVDVDGVAVNAFAKERGVSASNAGVRVFRAREALRKRVVESCGTCAEHGCFDCTCPPPANP